MQISVGLKYITGIAELLLVLPLLGLYVSASWLSWILLALHVTTLIFSVREKTSKHGSILGIVVSLLPWIPFVTMGLRFLTGILLIADNQRI